MVASLLLRLAPLMAEVGGKYIANPLVRRSVKGAALGGYGAAEFMDQDMLKRQAYAEGGLSPEEIDREMSKGLGTTLLRALPALAGQALTIYGPTPQLKLLGLGLEGLGGLVQGADTAISRGDDALGIASETLSGTGQGLLGGAFDVGSVSTLKELLPKTIRNKL